MKTVFVIALLLLTVVGAVLPAQAEGKPIQISLYSPVQIVPPDQSIAGLRLSILYGRNANMTGFDWGLVTRTTGNLVGLQDSFVGFVDGNTTGIQLGFVPMTKGSMTGLQWGFVTSAGHVEGLQLGFVNSTGTIHGLQIGLLNFVKKGGWLPLFPIVNGKL